MSLKRRDDDWRINPFQEIARLEDEMSNIFKNVFGDRDIAPTQRTFVPLVDLRETDSDYIMEVDLPGFKKDDIKIELSKDDIEISAQRTEETEESSDEGKYLRRERCGYRFYRRIKFPTPVNTDAVQSEYKNGTIKIELPKTEESKRKLLKLE